MPEVSIIIPLYNAEKNLEKTLKSILEQSYTDIEVICVDMGSTDNTLSFLEKYSVSDSRVQVYSQPEQCKGKAYNTGLENASGSYLFFLNSGDTLLPYALECAVAKSKAYNIDCITVCAVPFDPTLNTTVENADCQYSNFNNGNFHRLLSVGKDEAVLKMNVAEWAAIYRREFLEENKISFPELNFFCGRSFFFEVIRKANRLFASRDRVILHNLKTPDELDNYHAEHIDELIQSVQVTERKLCEENTSDDIYKKILFHELDFLYSIAERLSGNPDYGVLILDKVTDFFENANYPGGFRYIRKINELRRNSEWIRLQTTENQKAGVVRKSRENKRKEFFFSPCESPKVSVIVPTYNQINYLNLALESLSKQTLREIEFICVNDGSTDSSLAILKQYAAVDQRVIIIDKPNSGYGHSMNVGIDAARGKYIGILEPDDFVEPDMFKTLYDTASKKNLDFIKSNFNRFWENEDGTEKNLFFPVGEDGYYDRVLKPMDELRVWDFTMNTWSGIYKRSYLNKYHIRHNETPGASYQDNGFWFQTFMHAKRAMFMNRSFYMNRRDNPNSSMFAKGKFFAITNEYKFILEKLNQYPETKAKLEQIYYKKKFFNFVMTYNRLASEHKLEYLFHMKEEFSEPVSRGILNENCMSPYLWNMLTEVIHDPESWYSPIRVSVIIPAYNVEKYIRQCLDSLLVRDEVRSEVIVVDDGSTDRTLEILKEFEEKDDRVKVIEQANAGAGTARNNGMKYATGEYLAFLDADDFYDPEMLRLAYEISWSDRSDVTVWCSDNYIESKRIFTENKSSIRRDLLPEKRPFAGIDVNYDIFRVFIGWPWDKMFRTEFVRKNGLYFQEQRTTNDLLFVFSAVAQAERISTLEAVLSHHRRQKSGSLSVSREKSWGCFYYALTALRDHLKNRGLYERFERDFINYALHFSLWNINSLKGDSYYLLYDKLKQEWFEELGITQKQEGYFYENDAWQTYHIIMKLDPDEYLHFRINLFADKFTELNVKVIDGIEKINRLEEDYKHIRNSISFKIGRMITFVPRGIKWKLKKKLKDNQLSPIFHKFIK